MTLTVSTRPGASRSHHECSVAAPYRLDLTVSVLRRLSTNVVDVLTPAGQYVRALPGSREPVIARVTQVRPDTLAVVLEGDEREHPGALALVRRMLGVDRDLAHFDRAAAGIPWLEPLAARMRGVKPPRYPTLWEACVNVIVFQQISLQAASAIMGRLIVALGPPIESHGVRSHAFPSAETILGAEDSVLRAAGLSPGKLATLQANRRGPGNRRAGRGDVGAAPEPRCRGTSPRDQGDRPVDRGGHPASRARPTRRVPCQRQQRGAQSGEVAGSAPLDVDRVVGALRPQQGMLYYHLLLARLESRGELGRPSAPRAAASVGA